MAGHRGGPPSTARRGTGLVQSLGVLTAGLLLVGFVLVVLPGGLGVVQVRSDPSPDPPTSSPVIGSRGSGGLPTAVPGPVASGESVRADPQAFPTGSPATTTTTPVPGPAGPADVPPGEPAPPSVAAPSVPSAADPAAPVPSPSATPAPSPEPTTTTSPTPTAGTGTTDPPATGRPAWLPTPTAGPPTPPARGRPAR